MHINNILNEGYSLNDVREVEVTPEIRSALPRLGELKGDYRDLYDAGFLDYIHEFYTKNTAIEAYDGVEALFNEEPDDYGQHYKLSEDEVQKVVELMDELENMKFDIKNEPVRAYIVDKELGNKLIKAKEHVAVVGDKVIWGWGMADIIKPQKPEQILAKLV